MSDSELHEDTIKSNYSTAISLERLSIFKRNHVKAEQNGLASAADDSVVTP